MRPLVLTFLLLAALSALSAEPPAQSTKPAYPLWDGQETIAEYAKKTGLEPTKTLDLGDGVKLELVLILPQGELVDHVNMGYGSTYSKYLLLEMKDGKLTGERKFDDKEYQQFREKQFQAFKKTTEYKELAAKMREKGDDQEFIDSFLRSFVVEYTSIFLDEEAPPKESVAPSKPTTP